MQLTKRDMELLFRKLDVVDVKSNHHVSGKILVDSVDGEMVIRIRYSHGNGDIPRVVMHRIRRGLGLTESELKELVSCTLSKVAWAELAVARLPRQSES